MANKNIQIKYDNAGTWDELYPKTKLELVEGASNALAGKVDKVLGKGLSTEDYTTSEKDKLTGIAVAANNYAHPTGDGNQHVPATGTTNNGKVLKAGATAGSASWQNLAAGDIPALALSKISDAGTAAGRNVGTASGDVPLLGENGKLDSGVLPALAISETFEVANQAAMLALTAQRGDIAIRTDQSKSYILSIEPAGTLANWKELLTPTSPVQSVAGKTGTVTLVKGDVGLGVVENYGIATQAEAEAGIVATKYMTPERTKQAIIAQVAGLGNGDMQTSVYDKNNNGKVDVAELAESVAWESITAKPSTFPVATHQHSAADITSGTLAAARLPAATTAAVGGVQLNDAINSTSTAQAATANAVKKVADIASDRTKIVLSATAPTGADIWYQEI